jgi:hypothetical protein
MGSGYVGVSVPMKDPLGFYYNPAQLGYFSRENNFAALVQPQGVNWTPGYSSSPVFINYGFSAGYNFKKSNGLPVSVGAGFIYNKFDYNYLQSSDEFKCFSVGAGVNYLLQFSAGFSVKKLSGVSANAFAYSALSSSVNGTAYDFGAMMTVPVSDLFFSTVKYRLDDKSFIKPLLDLTAGYSLLNFGKETAYYAPDLKSPLPRTAMLGYTAEIGANLVHPKVKMNIFYYDYTSEAEDILVEYNNDGSVWYHSMLGNIKPFKNLVALKNDGNIVIHRGNILRLFETLYITSGKYYGNHYNNIRSNGYGFSSEGIFKLLRLSVNNDIVRFIENHFVIEYYDTYNYVGMFNTNFQSLAVYIKGF